jgi:hypothetical protein
MDKQKHGRCGLTFFVSMVTVIEVYGKYDTESDCAALLYAPLSEDAKYRESRVYTIEYEGDADQLVSFVKEVLVDSISQVMVQDGALLCQEARFYLDYGMKSSGLDLEKETILAYLRGSSVQTRGFKIKQLKIKRRVYVLSQSQVKAEPFVRDLCNAAIHEWKVVEL